MVALEDRVRQVEAGTIRSLDDGEYLATQIDGIKRGLIPLPRQSVLDDLATRDLVTASLAPLTRKLNQLLHSLNGGAVAIGTHSLGSFDEVKSFVQKHFPPQFESYHCFYDTVAILCSIGGKVAFAQDVMQKEIHAERVKRAPLKTVMIHSFHTQVPPVFAGSQDKELADKNPFGAIKTYLDWNPGDGIGGVYNKINGALPDLKKTLLGMMRHHLADHPIALQLCEQLLVATLAFIDVLSAEIAGFYRFLLTTTYGVAGPYTAKAQALCWELVEKLLSVFFLKTRTVRAPAQHAYSSIEDTDDLNATFLWAIVQAHGVMQDFQEYEFRRHPLVYPEIVHHIFTTYTTKEEVASQITSCGTSRVTQRCQELETKCSELKRNYDQLFQQIGKLKKKVNAPNNKDYAWQRQNGAGNNGGGD